VRAGVEVAGSAGAGDVPGARDDRPDAASRRLLDKLLAHPFALRVAAVEETVMVERRLLVDHAGLGAEGEDRESRGVDDRLRPSGHRKGERFARPTDVRTREGSVRREPVHERSVVADDVDFVGEQLPGARRESQPWLGEVTAYGDDAVDRDGEPERVEPPAKPLLRILGVAADETRDCRVRPGEEPAEDVSPKEPARAGQQDAFGPRARLDVKRRS